MTISHSTNGGGSHFRLVHVSDTHLSRTHGYFDVNWSAFRQAMAASPPDMLIHGGDISFNGPAAPLDLAHAAEEIAALGLPWRAIPGNHDIGEAPDFSRLNQHINRRAHPGVAAARRRPVVVLRCAALAADRPRHRADGVEPAGGGRAGRIPGARARDRAARCMRWCSSTCRRSSAIISRPQIPTSYIPITARDEISRHLRECGREGDRLRAQARLPQGPPPRHGHRLGAGHRHGRRQASARPPRQFSTTRLPRMDAAAGTARRTS